MPPTSASLVVKISADINDFSKGLDAATRGVDRAAKKIEGFGKALTIGITVPVVAAATALAKMAAENEDTAARLERVFGSAATSVNTSIKKMMASIPEANTDLQKMAISVDNMAQGLGLAPGNAARMSESLLKLAGDASAFAHVPMAEALDALSRGLAGKTRGLLQFGIAINEAEIKRKALDVGLVHEGNTLTETGTALASYALIMERSTRIQGEAERTAGQAGKSFAFLKRGLSELADNVSHLVLPALSDLAKNARTVVGWFASLDESTVKTFFNIAAAAALIGPTLVILVKLIEAAVKLRAAFALIAAGSVSTTLGGLASLPFATIAAGVGAVAVALGGLYLAWQKFKDQDKSGAGPFASMAGLADDPRLKKALGVGAASGTLKIEHTAPSEDQLQGFLGGKNAPTEIAPSVDAMKLLEERAHNVTDALKQMGEGWDVPGVTDEWNATLLKVIQRLATIKDAMDPIAVKLRGIATDLTDAIGKTLAPQGLPDVSKLPGVAGGVREGITMSPRVAELPGLTAANLAALRYADAQDYATEKIAYDYQRLRSNLEQFGIHLTNVSENMQGAILTIANAAQNFAMQLASTIGGSGPAAGTGRGIGGLIGGAAGFYFGGPMGAAVGSFLGTAAGGLIGSLFDHAKTSTDNAAISMDSLAKQVEKVTQSITNVPQWFKVQVERFAAAPVMTAPPFVHTPGGPSSNASAGSAALSIGAVHVHVANAADAGDMNSMMDKIYAAALKQRGTGSRAPLVFARTGAI